MRPAAESGEEWLLTYDAARWFTSAGSGLAQSKPSNRRKRVSGVG